jgi:hypothetical protein
MAFKADLRHRGIEFHVPSDPLVDTAWITLLQRVYAPPTGQMERATEGGAVNFDGKRPTHRRNGNRLWPRRVGGGCTNEQTHWQEIAHQTKTTENKARSYGSGSQQNGGTRLAYDRYAIDEFIQLYCSEPGLSFSKVVVARFRIALENRGLAAGTINGRLAAVRAWPMRLQMRGCSAPNWLPAFGV